MPAEPITIVYSVATLVTQCWKLVSGTNGTITHYKSVPDSLKLLADTVITVRTLMDVVNLQFVDRGPSAPPLVQNNVFTIAIEGIERVLSRIEARFGNLHAEVTWRTRLKTLWKQDEMDRLMHDLQVRYFSLHLLMINANIITSTTSYAHFCQGYRSNIHSTSGDISTIGERFRTDPHDTYRVRAGRVASSIVEGTRVSLERSLFESAAHWREDQRLDRRSIILDDNNRFSLRREVISQRSSIQASVMVLNQRTATGMSTQDSMPGSALSASSEDRARATQPEMSEVRSFQGFKPEGPPLSNIRTVVPHLPPPSRYALDRALPCRTPAKLDQNEAIPRIQSNGGLLVDTYEHSAWREEAGMPTSAGQEWTHEWSLWINGTECEEMSPQVLWQRSSSEPALASLCQMGQARSDMYELPTGTHNVSTDTLVQDLRRQGGEARFSRRIWSFEATDEFLETLDVTGRMSESAGQPYQAVTPRFSDDNDPDRNVANGDPGIARSPSSNAVASQSWKSARLSSAIGFEEMTAQPMAATGKRFGKTPQCPPNIVLTRRRHGARVKRLTRKVLQGDSVADLPDQPTGVRSLRGVAEMHLPTSSMLPKPRLMHRSSVESYLESYLSPIATETRQKILCTGREDSNHFPLTAIDDHSNMTGESEEYDAEMNGDWSNMETTCAFSKISL